LERSAQRPEGRQTSRVRVVMEYVKDLIVSGRIGAGEQIPTELEIARTLNVSRTPVREAIKILDAAGLVEIRRGAGTYVRQGMGASLAQLMLFQTYLDDASPRKLMEVRQVFERSCAEMAAQRRGEADLEAMRSAIDHLRDFAAQGDPAPRMDAILEADLAFHRAVYQAAHNELITTMANFVLDMVSPWIRRSIEVAGPGNAIRLHEIMLAMIESQNVGGAREVYARDPVILNMDHFRITLETPHETPQY
jgi:DNA-binding FadR family transcriptional regulator